VKQKETTTSCSPLEMQQTLVYCNVFVTDVIVLYFLWIATIFLNFRDFLSGFCAFLPQESHDEVLMRKYDVASVC